MSKIQITAGNELLEISFQDVKKYHGGPYLMALAVGFRCLQAALKELSEGRTPDRSEISIKSGHAGPGFRDAFEYVTRAYTRDAYEVDVTYPVAQYDPHRAQSYAFIISASEGKAVEVSLREDFLPPVFYDYLKKGRNHELTEREAEENRKLILELSERALKLPEDELLSIKKMN